MGNVCSGPSVSSLSNIYLSGLSSPAMAANSGLDPVHPNVAKQKQYQEVAFKSLNIALSIDESQNSLEAKAKAIPHYKTGKEERIMYCDLYYFVSPGVQALQAGISLALPRDDTDPGLARAHKLREKMMGNLATARERLTFLTTSLHLNKLSLQAGGGGGGRARPSKPGVVRSNTFTKEEKKLKFGCEGSSATRVASSPVSSPTTSRPRNNRAAELRLKTNNSDKSRSGSINSITPTNTGSANYRKSTERENLKKSCGVIKGCDSKLVESILNEVIPRGTTGVTWADVSGQEKAKTALHEMVVMPTLRPELFTGLREPAKGLLMFGPPGNGKTLLARALAAEASSNLINISSSSLTSKWLGEGEKLVKALFSVARHIQPTIIFIDEIDAILSERRSGEHEGVRRIKTEFLLQFEGMTTGANERVVVVAATNRPQELDDAALRRFTKRVYVRMPDIDTRTKLLTNLLAKQGSPLTHKEITRIVAMTEGYTCSDISNLARDAALAPVREFTTTQLATVQPKDIRNIQLQVMVIQYFPDSCLDSLTLPLQDFVKSSERIRKSLSKEGLHSFEKWNEAFGDVS